MPPHRWRGEVHDEVVDALTSEGLGLDHAALRLERTTDGWLPPAPACGTRWRWPWQAGPLAWSWIDYLRLRDLVRESGGARHRYQAVKVQLLAEVANDRRPYTDGKSAIVRSLLGEIDE